MSRISDSRWRSTPRGSGRGHGTWRPGRRCGTRASKSCTGFRRAASAERSRIGWRRCTRRTGRNASLASRKRWPTRGRTCCCTGRFGPTARSITSSVAERCSSTRMAPRSEPRVSRSMSPIESEGGRRWRTRSPKRVSSCRRCSKRCCRRRSPRCRASSWRRATSRPSATSRSAATGTPCFPSRAIASVWPSAMSPATDSTPSPTWPPPASVSARSRSTRLHPNACSRN